MIDTRARLTIDKYGDIIIVDFKGFPKLNEVVIPDIGPVLYKLAEGPNPKLLLDFSEVRHIYACSLGVLINLDKRIKQQSGQWRLVSVEPRVHERFKLTGLDKVFRIFPNRKAGLGSFN